MTTATATLPETKTCNSCGQVKPLALGFSRGSGTYGYRSKCKACRNKSAPTTLAHDYDREPEYDPAEIEARIAEVRAEKIARGERRGMRPIGGWQYPVGKAGYRGVTDSGNPVRPWKAQGYFDGQKVYLGTHKTAVDAALAYDAAARRRGITHSLNFPGMEANP